MKIKRYLALSMRAALAQVRAEQGPDAVILSSRRVEEGIEVIAAVDYDEALFVDATLRRAPVVAAETAEIPIPTPEVQGVPAAADATPRMMPAARAAVPAAAVALPERTAVAQATGTAVRNTGAAGVTGVVTAALAATTAKAARVVTAAMGVRTGRTPSVDTVTSSPDGLAAASSVKAMMVAPPGGIAAVGGVAKIKSATVVAVAGRANGDDTAATAGTVRSAKSPVAARAATILLADTVANAANAAPNPSDSAGAAEPVSLLVRASLQERPQDDGFRAMQQEVRNLRELLQGELAHMSWNDKRLREPLQARVLEELSALDIAPDVAMKLAALAPSRTSLDDPSHIPLAMLVRHLPVVDPLSTVNGGVIALVGPTGAGKTTTIAKLAARWSMQHGPKDLALVSTDDYRIGAREQLMTYARILGAPMHVANNGSELSRVLERLKSKKLVLIDTAGMGPRDVRLSEQLAALQLGAARARVLLALPAQGEGHALEEIVRSFSSVKPAACVITKVDEAASLGAVISTTLRHQLRIAYLCTGQRVPEDLHAAHERKVWLIRVAMKLKEHAPPRGNDGYLARNFGRAPAHA